MVARVPMFPLSAALYVFILPFGPIQSELPCVMFVAWTTPSISTRSVNNLYPSREVPLLQSRPHRSRLDLAMRPDACNAHAFAGDGEMDFEGPALHFLEQLLPKVVKQGACAWAEKKTRQKEASSPIRAGKNTMAVVQSKPPGYGPQEF